MQIAEGRRFQTEATANNGPEAGGNRQVLKPLRRLGEGGTPYREGTRPLARRLDFSR